MNSLSMSQKRRLKSIAHHLKPVIQIGQKGITDSLITAIDKALEDHELIKVKFMDFKDEKGEISNDVSERTNSDLVDIIGNIAIFYRQNTENEDQK